MAGSTPPWKRRNPKKPSQRTVLTPAQKAEAKHAAEQAGRPYPNLVDNMRAAAKARKQGATAPAMAAKRPANKSAGTSATKTAAKPMAKKEAGRATGKAVRKSPAAVERDKATHA